MPSIDVLANTRAAQSSIKDLSKALDGTADALDDMARDGDRAGDKLEKSFREMTRASERASKDIAADAKDTARKVEREYDDLGTTGTAGFAKVREGAQEVQQEIGSNLGEAVSSIRGDLSDLGQVGQDTLGGLAATLASTGPAGIAGAAVLAAGAVGLGLVTAELEKQQEEADKLRDRLTSAYQDAASEGRQFLDTAQYIEDALDLMYNPDRVEEYKRVQADANALGMDLADVMRANTGDLEQQENIQSRINALLADAAKEAEGARGLYQLGDVENTKKGLEEIRDRWSGINDITTENVQRTRTAQDVVSGYLLDAIDKAGIAASAVDDFGNKLYDLPDDTQVVVEAATGKATDDVSKFKGEVTKLNGTTATVQVNAVDNVSKILDGLANTRRTVNVDVNYRGQGGTTWH